MKIPIYLDTSNASAPYPLFRGALVTVFEGQCSICGMTIKWFGEIRSLIKCPNCEVIHCSWPGIINGYLEIDNA